MQVITNVHAHEPQQGGVSRLHVVIAVNDVFVDIVVFVVGQRTFPSPSHEPQRPTCSELLRFVFRFIHKQRPTVITPSFKYQRAPT